MAVGDTHDEPLVLPNTAESDIEDEDMEASEAWPSRSCGFPNLAAYPEEDHDVLFVYSFWSDLRIPVKQRATRLLDFLCRETWTALIKQDRNIHGNRRHRFIEDYPETLGLRLSDFGHQSRLGEIFRVRGIFGNLR